MSLLIFLLIIVIVLVAVCWVIQLLPFPPSAPPWAKQALMAFVIAVGLIVLLLQATGTVVVYR